MYHPRFKGNPYEIGLKYGNLLKKNKIQLFGLSELDDFQLNYGKQSEQILKRFFPEACEEMRGISEGLGVSYENLSAWLMCISVCFKVPDSVIHGCSMLALKKNNAVVLGRNNDLPPIFRKISNSALYNPSNGYSFIANSSAFVSAEEGINEQGLAVGMTYVWAKELKPGINSMFLVRYMLEKCANIEDGLSTIKNIPIGGAYHLILADKKEITHIECSPQKIKEHIGDYVIATNHFTSEEMRSYEEPKDLYHSHERYKTGFEVLNKGFKNLSFSAVNYTKDILSGKHGFMCQYEKNLNFDTVWSSIFDITNKRIYRSEGNPSKIKYQEDIRLKFSF